MTDAVTHDMMANAIRALAMDAVEQAKSGHPGMPMGMADVATVLFTRFLKYDPADPQWEDRDRFVLSKGHCVPAQYYCMARAGYFPMDRLITLRKLGSPLQGHPDRVMLPGIEAATGSLGQGLSVAIGMALGLKLAGKSARVYCVVGDGETQEGQIWESLMSAPKLGAPDHHLDNLCVILDYNGIQLDNFVKKILDLEPVTDKLKSFGWPVLEVNGHDIAQVDKALDQAEATKGGPTFIVAHTIKGKGVSFMENDPEWHGKAPKPEEAVRAIQEIVGSPVPGWAEPIIAELAALGKK